MPNKVILESVYIATDKLSFELPYFPCAVEIPVEYFAHWLMDKINKHNYAGICFVDKKGNHCPPFNLRIANSEKVDNQKNYQKEAIDEIYEITNKIIESIKSKTYVDIEGWCYNIQGKLNYFD